MFVSVTSHVSTANNRVVRMSVGVPAYVLNVTYKKDVKFHSMRFRGF